ncbi:MAG: hypothetical protein OM95_04150 [Bdellovibrio sp. ArHS]|uniref:hypothetical protein n=1 Tax=Bdellovibrio sp. ArHS TaxID=1569284 RepID=UPI0005829FE7|nr:hypothetical protein [Bdellovibrio sp. ArHS]KHD89324.1 MAG: hypothetical protein OM95_04150 [Bdellovibrio sp. ArHS]
MKTKVLSALLLLTLLWGTLITYQYWQLKNNPRVVAIALDAGRNTMGQTQANELEKLTFLRQFLERYYNYDSNNFWQSQTALAALMTPRLADGRVREVNRLRDKIQQKNLSHLSRLVTLQKVGTESYQAVTELQITEAANSNEETTQSRLYISTNLTIQTAERTLENPWGLLVSDMKIENSSTQAKALPAQIRISKNAPTVLLFPCPVESLENSFEKNLNIKITTLNVSELQLTPLEGAPEQMTLSASCRNEDFKLDLATASTTQDLYVAIPKELGNARKKVPATKSRPKDVYDKTIESVLGIKLED